MGLKDYIKRKREERETAKANREALQDVKDERELKSLRIEAEKSKLHMAKYKEKDILKREVSTYKAEKFKRSGVGRFVSGLESFSSGFGGSKGLGFGGGSSKSMFGGSSDLGLGFGGNLFGTIAPEKKVKSKKRKSKKKKKSSGKGRTVTTRTVTYR